MHPQKSETENERTFPDTVAWSRFVCTNYLMQKLNELEYHVIVHWLHEVDS